jgi:hypothetical protein
VPLGQDDVDAGWRETVATEWYFAVVPHVKVGVFHVATERCAPALVGADGDWCQQLGAFARIEEAWASRDKEDETETATPPRETAPKPPPSKPIDVYDFDEDTRPRY